MEPSHREPAQQQDRPNRSTRCRLHQRICEGRTATAIRWRQPDSSVSSEMEHRAINQDAASRHTPQAIGRATDCSTTGAEIPLRNRVQTVRVPCLSEQPGLQPRIRDKPEARGSVYVRPQGRRTRLVAHQTSKGRASSKQPLLRRNAARVRPSHHKQAGSMPIGPSK